MQVALQCPCGQSHIADHTMAGTLISCQCGRRLDVPSLREMKRQVQGYARSATELTGIEPGVLVDTNRPRALHNELPSWGVWSCLGAYFAFKLMLGTYLGFAVVAINLAGIMGLLGAGMIGLAQICLAAQMYGKEGASALVVAFFPVIGLVAAIGHIQDELEITRWFVILLLIGLILIVGGAILRFGFGLHFGIWF